MRKRLSYLLFSVIITSSFMIGCSNDSTNPTDDPTSSPETIAENPAFLTPGYTKTSPSVLTAAYTINNQTKHFKGDIFQSSSNNENVILVSENGSLTLENGVINKLGNTTTETDSESYGQNAALAVINGSTASITNTTVTSGSYKANAVVSAGERSSITAKDLAITTIGDSSGGLVASYGGQIQASNVTITTTGAYSAPVSIEDDGGSIHITRGKLSASHGVSPCLFSSGDLVLDHVTGNSLNHAASIKGGSVTWNDSSFVSNGNYGILLYETLDSGSGTTQFSSENSRFSTTASESIFYATNTSASIDLTNTVIDSSCNVLLNCTGNTNEDWGVEGENGANVELNADTQVLSGNILCDSISQVSIQLQNNSSLTGSINPNNTGDSVSLHLDSSSTWTVTDTSYLHILKNANSSCSNIISNGNTIYYDDSETANRWLGGKTIELDNGGSLTPMK